MPLMNKLRDNTLTIMIGLVIAFVIMIIFEWGMDFGGMGAQRQQQQNYVGKVNDREITYQEFSDVMRNVTEMQRQQFGGEIDDEFMGFIREQVWENLVNEILLEEEINRRGIQVTDDEIVDWVFGERPPDFLRQQFMDEEGNFNREAYDMALSDPRNRDQILQLEQMLRQQRKQEKLQSLLLSSIRVTEGEIRQRFKEDNVRMDARYVVIDPNRIVSADEVTITDEEIQRYYDANPQEFMNPPRRNLKYVKFPFVPSPADTQDVIREIDDFKVRIEQGEDFLELVENYSHTPFADAFFRPGDLSPEKERTVFGGEVGDVVGPVIDNDGAHLIKIVDTRTGQNTYVRAQHILLGFEGDEEQQEAQQQAEELIAQLNDGADFGDLAREYSTDPGSGQRGGDLGWFGRGRMVPPFEEAAFDAQVGEIVGPVESQFGYHIIKVNDRTDKEVKFATLHLPIEVSSFTRNEIYDEAADFAFVANRRNFEEEAEIFGVQVQETGLFSENGVIPGIGRSESVMRFAFDHRSGTISDVLEAGGDGYGVFLISETIRESVRPLDEVRSQIQSTLRDKKRREMAEAKIYEITQQLEGRSLEAISEIDPSLSVRTAEDFGINSNISGVGRDHRFVGAAFGLEPGEISQPIEGSRNFYLIEVLQRTEFDEEQYAEQRDSIKEQILQSKQQQFFSRWLEGLREDAEIVDNRYRFFR